MKVRNDTFDILKGIGIILMMFCHYANDHSNIVYSFHMPMFLIISGYYAKTINLSDAFFCGKLFVKKTCKRLLLPYCVTMLMCCIWGLFQTLFKHNIDYFVRFPLSFIWAGADIIESEKYGLIFAGPMWFLIALCLIKILFAYLAGYILEKVHSKPHEIVVVVCIIISLVAIFLHPYISPFPWCIIQALASIQFYAIGWYVQKQRFHNSFILLSFVLWILSIFCAKLDIAGPTYSFYPLNVLGACGGVLVLYKVVSLLIRNLKRVDKNIFSKRLTFFQWVGLNSLTVLCMHTFETDTGILFSILCRLPFEVGDNVLIVVRMALSLFLAWSVSNIPVLKRVYK